jgi:hypothetical protein
MAAPAQRISCVLGLALVLSLAAATAAYASWGVALTANSTAEASAGSAPAIPSGAASACASLFGTAVKVTWNPAANATSYTVWQSTTSATSGFTIAATGINSTTWTSNSLATGSYWFEVSSSTGSNWTSANSSATAKRTILLAACN